MPAEFIPSPLICKYNQKVLSPGLQPNSIILAWISFICTSVKPVAPRNSINYHPVLQLFLVMISCAALCNTHRIPIWIDIPLCLPRSQLMLVRRVDPKVMQSFVLCKITAHRILGRPQGLRLLGAISLNFRDWKATWTVWADHRLPTKWSYKAYNFCSAMFWYSSAVLVIVLWKRIVSRSI